MTCPQSVRNLSASHADITRNQSALQNRREKKRTAFFFRRKIPGAHKALLRTHVRTHADKPNRYYPLLQKRLRRGEKSRYIRDSVGSEKQNQETRK